MLDADTRTSAYLAERAVLGSVLADNAQLILVRDAGLTEHHFGVREHSVTFAAMCRLEDSNRPIDETTLHSELVGTELSSTPQLARSLLKALDSVGRSDRAATYASFVLEASSRRRLMAVGWELAARAEGDEDIAEVRVHVAEQLERTWASTDEWIVDGPSAVDAALAPRATERWTSTGFSAIRLPRLGDGYTIVCGCPGHGKSALATQILWHSLLEGRTVLLVTPEMDSELCIRRLVALVSRATLDVVHEYFDRGEAPVGRHAELAAAADHVRLTASRLYIVDDGPMTGAGVYQHAARVHRRAGSLDLVVVDHFHILDHGEQRGERADQAMARTSGVFRRIQKRFECSVVTLAQLNRRVHERAIPIPGLGDLRECGALEQDAGLIVGLYRPACHPKAGREEGAQDPAAALLSIIKNRHGETGIKRLVFDPCGLRFEEAA